MAELSLYTLSQEMKNYLLLSGGSVTGLLKLKDVKIDGRINYDDGNNIINYNLSTIEIGKNDIYLYCDNLIGASKDSNNTIQNWTINKNGQGIFKSLMIDDITDDEVNGNKAVNKNYVDNKIEDLNIDEGYGALTDLINQNKTDTDNAIQNLNNSLSNEISNRTYADDTMDSQIGLLEEGLSNEINRAKDAEESLQKNINNLDDKLTLEITRAIESENTINEKIESEITDRIEDVARVAQDLQNEITRAIESENTINERIDKLNYQTDTYTGYCRNYSLEDSDITLTVQLYTISQPLSMGDVIFVNVVLNFPPSGNVTKINLTGINNDGNFSITLPVYLGITGNTFTISSSQSTYYNAFCVIYGNNTNGSCLYLI